MTSPLFTLILKLFKMSSSNQLFEGIGAPVNVAQTEDQYIDPTLDSCCQREVCFVTYDMIIFYIHTFMILSHST